MVQCFSEGGTGPLFGHGVARGPPNHAITNGHGTLSQNPSRLCIICSPEQRLDFVSWAKVASWDMALTEKRQRWRRLSFDLRGMNGRMSIVNDGGPLSHHAWKGL